MAEVDSVHLRRLHNRVAHTTARVVEHTGVDASALAGVRLPWYEVRNQAAGGGGGPATVLIFDEIGGSFGISAKKFVQDLEAIDAPVIHVRINSPGGSLFDAIAIYNALHHHPAHVVVYVDSLAASAASVIAMGGDEVVMMPGSQMMIHDASALEDGNSADHAKMVTFLDRQSGNVADIYRLRGGGTVEAWRELMLAETWMFAQEAVAAGLADRVEVVAGDQADGVLEERMRRSFDLSGYRYAGRDAAPAPRRVTARVSVQQRSMEAPMATTTGRSAELLREAGQLRAAKAEELAAAGQSTTRGVEYRFQPPTQPDRRVCTKWLARDAGRPMPVLLRGQKQTRDGKPWYVVEGYATVYERAYEMWDWAGPYNEIVSVGAGDATVAASPDVVFLVNHRGLAMARTAQAATLELWSDSTGMGDRAWLNPTRHDVADLVSGIDDRVITEQSFAFVIVSGQWSPDYTEYRINEFDVNRGDVSAVNYGANPYTDISSRAREIFDDLDHLPAAATRAAYEMLSRRLGALDTSQPSPMVSVRQAQPVSPPAPVGAGMRLSAVDAWLARAEI
jgi:ATP-dependent protease ClpP protease subunit/phage head maturation protease